MTKIEKKRQINLRLKIVDYDKIMNIEVNVNPIESLLSVGTIKIFSGEVSESKHSRSNKYDKFIGISNPYGVFKSLKDIETDIKTDWNYPNAIRPNENPGYKTKYTGKDE